MRWYLLPSLLIVVSCNVFAVYYAKNCKEAVQLAQKSPAAQSCGYSFSCDVSNKGADGAVRSYPTAGKVGPNPKTGLQFTIDADGTTISAFCLRSSINYGNESCARHSQIKCTQVSTLLNNKDGYLISYQ